MKKGGDNPPFYLKTMEDEIIMEELKPEGLLDYLEQIRIAPQDEPSTHRLASLIENAPALIKQCGSVMEERLVEHSKQAAIRKMQEVYIRENSVSWPYSDAPYFTDREAHDILVREHLVMHRHTDMATPKPTDFRNRIQELQEQLKKTEDEEKRKELYAELIRLGWNPEVDYNAENIVKAKDRIKDQYSKEVNEFYFIDKTHLACDQSLPIAEEYYEKARVRESYPYTNVMVCVYEDGTYDVFYSEQKVTGLPSKKAEVYSFYVEKAELGDVRNAKIEVPIYESIFPLPSKVIASRVIKSVLEACDIDITNRRPVIYKIYEGVLDDTTIRAIDYHYAFMESYGCMNEEYIVNIDSIHSEVYLYKNLNLIKR